MCDARNQRLARNGGHGWIELVEICNLSFVSRAFVKILRKCLEFVLKVRSADLFAVAGCIPFFVRCLHGKDGSVMPG